MSSLVSMSDIPTGSERIQDLTRRQAFFIGHTATGEIAIRGHGRHVYEDRGRGDDDVLDTHKTMALALTECCIKAKLGRVYWVDSIMPDQCGFRFPNTPSEEYLRLPTLVYDITDWESEASSSWWDKTHVERLAALDARGNARFLNYAAPVLPISIGYQDPGDVLSDIKLYSTIRGSAFLHYDYDGNLYFGLVDDIATLQTGSAHPEGERRHLIIPKERLSQFRITSEEGIAYALRDAYLDRRVDCPYFYKINQYYIDAELAGASDRYPDPNEIIDEFDEDADPEEALQRLQQEVYDHWSQEQRDFYRRFERAANHGIGDAVDLFHESAVDMIATDDIWDRMTGRMRRSVLKFLKLRRICGKCGGMQDGGRQTNDDGEGTGEMQIQEEVGATDELQ